MEPSRLVPIAMVLLLACSAPVHPGTEPGETRALGASDPGGMLADLPLSFVENRGQADPRAAFYVQGPDTSVYFTPGGLRFALSSSSPNVPDWHLALEFVGASPSEPDARSRLPGIMSYFKGDPSQWETAVPTYERVLYEELWPGIDLVYSGTGSELKYEFRVGPGADPSQIRLRYRGADDLRITPSGALAVSTPARTFTDAAPVSSQGSDEVETAYDLDGDVYGFDLGDYDPARSLVIDPAVLLYAGYVGGSDLDSGRGIALDGAGNAYVTGVTESTDATFPEAVGPDLGHNGGTQDVFVARVNAGGATLGYAGYIGGSSSDRGSGIAVDAAGNAYVTGQTQSSEASFPVTVGPDLIYGGGTDAFVARVNAGGASLGYAGYVGGTSFDNGVGIALDGAGNAYVSGQTTSTEGSFPVTGGPDVVYNGSGDAFVARVNAGGATLGYAGYIGGTGVEDGTGIALDGAGNAYVTGTTDSTEASFPVMGGPDLIHNGDDDAYVARVNAGGATLGYAGYIGGGSTDLGLAIAVDGAGNAYVTGEVDSPEASFPVTVGPDLSYNGNTDAFVARVNAGGATLGFAGYIGGTGLDSGVGIALDGAGNAYVTGLAESTEPSFPLMVGPDLTHNGGGGDAFVARVNAGGSTLGYAGYIGGSGSDNGSGIAVDGAGNAYVTGTTSSTETSFPVTGGPDLTQNGDSDAFVAEVETLEIAETCKGKPVTILGSEDDDTLAGTGGADVVAAFGGNDVINTGGGADTVCAGDGNDKANGGGGKDLLLGEQGNDRLSGGAGSKDRSVGGPGKDKLTGGGGKNDVCRGGPKKDTGGAGCEKGSI